MQHKTQMRRYFLELPEYISDDPQSGSSQTVSNIGIITLPRHQLLGSVNLLFLDTISLFTNIERSETLGTTICLSQK